VQRSLAPRALGISPANEAPQAAARSETHVAPWRVAQQPKGSSASNLVTP
jgi:hypothetical protein